MAVNDNEPHLQEQEVDKLMLRWSQLCAEALENLQMARCLIDAMDFKESSINGLRHIENTSSYPWISRMPGHEREIRSQGMLKPASGMTGTIENGRLATNTARQENISERGVCCWPSGSRRGHTEESPPSRWSHLQ